MTSINESNARESAKRQGYDIGHLAGYDEGWYDAMKWVRKEQRMFLWQKMIIAFVIGMGLVMLISEVQTACAAEEWGVSVTAQVPATEMNTTHAASTPMVAQPDSTLWSRMVEWVVEIFDN